MAAKCIIIIVFGLGIISFSCSDNKVKSTPPADARPRNPIAMLYSKKASRITAAWPFNLDSIQLAFKYIDSAIELVPTSIGFHSQKMQLLDQAGRINEAISESKKIISMYDENFYVLYTTAILYKKIKNYDSAARYYSLALDGIKNNRVKGMEPIEVDYFRLKILSRLKDTAEFTKGLLDFTWKYRNVKTANELLQLSKDTSKD